MSDLLVCYADGRIEARDPALTEWNPRIREKYPRHFLILNKWSRPDDKFTTYRYELFAKTPEAPRGRLVYRIENPDGSFRPLDERVLEDMWEGDLRRPENSFENVMRRGQATKEANRNAMDDMDAELAHREAFDRRKDSGHMMRASMYIPEEADDGR